jgi:hypothetical protein
MRWIKKFEAYEINIGDAKLSQIDINKILKGYLECALWTEEERLKEDMPNIDFNEDEDDEKMDEIEKIIHLNNSLNRKSIDTFTKEDIDVDSLIDAYSDIKKFIELAGKEVIDYAINEQGLERLGHDIWLTRNRHGAGFLDHSYDDDMEKKLIEASHKLKEINLYVGDDYKLYFN